MASSGSRAPTRRDAPFSSAHDAPSSKSANVPKTPISSGLGGALLVSPVVAVTSEDIAHLHRIPDTLRHCTVYQAGAGDQTGSRLPSPLGYRPVRISQRKQSVVWSLTMPTACMKA